jgi:hypothetical protein
MINKSMNYKRHYTLLIERAKTRPVITDYKEVHHIIPRCLGGNDVLENLVELYPEEHFLAHLLLVKIYPGNHKLVNAAAMMCVSSIHKGRINNKLYSWLRKKLANANSVSQTGKGNSQFGTCWVSNLETKECKKVDNNLLNLYLENGWIKKRIIKWDNPVKKQVCPICSKTFIGKSKSCSLSCGQKLSNKNNPKELVKGKLDSIIKNYKSGSSIHKCLIDAGLNGTGQNYTKLKKILQDL